MIIVKLQGGLANQIFQWLFGYSLSKKHNAEVYYDISYFHLEQVNIITDKRYFCVQNILKYEIPLINQEVLSRIKSKPLLIINDNFKNFNFNYDKNKIYYFNGYWQNEDYFKIYRKEILELLDLKINSNFDFSNSCSIHVRRGDYLKLQHFHVVQDIEYYKKSVQLIGDEKTFYIFSDDINWCKENFKFKNMIFVEGNSDIDDLKLMSLCKDNIIANSSYSWIAAWLNRNESKKIICPKKWFGNYQNDFFKKPAGWIEI